MDLNEMFSTTGLRVLRDELEVRINDWQGLLEDYPDDTNAVERLDVVKKLYDAINENLSLTTTLFSEVYAETADITYIMEETRVGGEPKATECVGWYYGKPNPEDTMKYSNRTMRATY